MSTKTRKNPFAQATDYNGPPVQSQNNMSAEMGEDPMFKMVSKQPNPFDNNMNSNFNSYEDFQADNVNNDFNSYDGFSNSGWNTGPSMEPSYNESNMVSWISLKSMNFSKFSILAHFF